LPKTETEVPQKKGLKKMLGQAGGLAKKFRLKKKDGTAESGGG